jgi:hypothetical protein
MKMKTKTKMIMRTSARTGARLTRHSKSMSPHTLCVPQMASTSSAEASLERALAHTRRVAVTNSVLVTDQVFAQQAQHHVAHRGGEEVGHALLERRAAVRAAEDVTRCCVVWWCWWCWCWCWC